MNVPVVFRDRALAEVREIIAWYKAKEDGSAERFRADLESTVAYLRQRPRAFQLRHKHYRFAKTRKFRYHLIYAVVNEVVVIYHVRHMHRKTLKRFFGS